METSDRTRSSKTLLQLFCVFDPFQAQQLDSLNTAELLSMLSFGADRILANEGGQPPSDAELDSILDRSKHTAKILQVNGSSSTGSPVSAADHDALSRAASSSSDAAGIRSLQLNAASFKPSQPPPSTFTLNGVDYSREAMNKIKREAAAAVAAARAGEVGGGSSNVAMRKLTGHQKQEEVGDCQKPKTSGMLAVYHHLGFVIQLFHS